MADAFLEIRGAERMSILNRKNAKVNLEQVHFPVGVLTGSLTC